MEEALTTATTSLASLLTPAEVALLLGVAKSTLERWRIVGDGPPFIKLSRSTVRYRRDDVSAFVAACSKRNTAQ